MISAIVSRLVILGCGILYPAYASFKAVRSKSVESYRDWMMYWIVFALFCCIETGTDIILAWFPFYYEVKVSFVLWLLPPTINGAGLLYRGFVHPLLKRKERAIDQGLVRLQEQGYTLTIQLVKRCIIAGRNIIMPNILQGSSTRTVRVQANVPVAPSVSQVEIREMDTTEDESRYTNRNAIEAEEQPQSSDSRMKLRKRNRKPLRNVEAEIIYLELDE